MQEFVSLSEKQRICKSLIETHSLFLPGSTKRISDLFGETVQ